MSPMDQALQQVEWTATGQQPSGDMPYATHSGVLEIAGMSLRCYRLNDGRAMFNAEDVESFFGGLLS